MAYDARLDSLLHIKKVSQNINKVSIELIKRSIKHDDSKFESPEKEELDKVVPILKQGKDAPNYEQAKIGAKKLMKVHKSKNSHHPEFYKNGVDGMNLLDLVEYISDMKAESQDNLEETLLKNAKKYDWNEQLLNIMKNTSKVMKWD